MRRFCHLIPIILLALLASSGPVHSQAGLERPSYDPFESEIHDLLGKSSTAPALAPEDLNSTILDIMEASSIPGLQTCIIYRDSIVWTGEYGYMDADLTIPVTTSTLFLQASISKTVVTTALLQCVEDGLVNLDADISVYLPFSVSNPYPPSEPPIPITCRTILSHVSGITGTNDIAWLPDMKFGEDWTGNLSQYLENYLVPGGSTYKATNYYWIDPGTYCEYSNWAFSLLALVVESATGVGFEDYVQENVFAPLGMDESSWFLANLNTDHIAMPIDNNRTYYIGDYPSSVTCGDLDAVSDDDLAVANNYSDNVSILLNNGDGTFQPAVNYAAGDGPSQVFSIDLDGDTYHDLAVANSYSDNVSILLNNGDGTFQAAVNYVAGDHPWSVFASDLDGDGDNDLAVANGADNTVSILINNGNGTFQSPTDYAVAGGPRSVVGSYLDGDSDIDLAVACRLSDRVSILLNNGDGTFQPAVHYVTGDYPQSVCASDLDGDSHNDLAVANSNSDDVSILLGNGDGTFQAAVQYPVGTDPRSVFCGDLDSDIDNDLVVANKNSNDFSILLGNGDGTFQTAVNYRAETGVGPYSVSLDDLDGDSDLDVAVANSLWDNVSLFFNNGDGTMAKYVALGHVSHPLWPIGLLKTSASQLAHHLATIPTYGTFKGERVLDALTVEQIMTNHYPPVFPGPEYRGLGWYSDMFSTGLVWGHAGSLPGCNTVMYVDPVQGNGVVLLSNTSYPNAGFVEIFNLLWEFSLDVDEDGVLIAVDNCPITYNPIQTDIDDDGIGDACDGCCVFRVGDANGLGGDEPTIGDISVMIDAKFISGTCTGILECFTEADINQTGGIDPTCDDITIGDISILIDYLFISGPTVVVLPECL